MQIIQRFVILPKQKFSLFFRKLNFWAFLVPSWIFRLNVLTIVKTFLLWSNKCCKMLWCLTNKSRVSDWNNIMNQETLFGLKRLNWDLKKPNLSWKSRISAKMPNFLKYEWKNAKHRPKFGLGPNLSWKGSKAGWTSYFFYLGTLEDGRIIAKNCTCLWKIANNYAIIKNFCLSASYQ